MSCDVSGNRLPFAPTFAANLRASREISLGWASPLRLSRNLSYNSGYFAEPDNILRQRPYAILDLSAEW